MTTQPSDWDVIALEVACRFTLDTEPQRRANLQVAVIDAIKRARELDASGGVAEPVAEIGPVYTLLWAGTETVSAIVNRHGLKVGDKLYATPRAAEEATTNSAQISSSLVVGDVGEDTRCRHDNGRPGYDLWHCSDCGAVKTDSGWGIAKHRYFNDRAEAEFFRKHGRLPDDGRPQPWGNAAMGAAGAGGGDG